MIGFGAGAAIAFGLLAIAFVFGMISLIFGPLVLRHIEKTGGSQSPPLRFSILFCKLVVWCAVSVLLLHFDLLPGEFMRRYSQYVLLMSCMGLIATAVSAIPFYLMLRWSPSGDSILRSVLSYSIFELAIFHAIVIASPIFLN